MSSLKTGILFLAFFLGSTRAEDEPNLEMHLVSVEQIEGSENYFRYNYTLEKLSETNFKVSGFCEELVAVDDTYGLLAVLGRAELDAPEPIEYETMMEFAKPVCQWMQSVYKMYFYDLIKDISNFPHYDKCPLEPQVYWYKDYVFDGESYKMFMRDGHYKIEMYLTKEVEKVAGLVMKMKVEPVAE